MDSYKNRLIEAYNHHAGERDVSVKQSWKLLERDEFLKVLRKRKLTRLLEIGAGPGHDAKFFQDSGMEVSCIDLSPNMVELCKEKGLDAQVMDFAQLAFPDQSFDAIWALNCLLHVPKVGLPVVLSEIQRVLRPEGLFYMGVYGRQNSEGIWEDDHYEPKRFFSFFDEETLKELLSEYFTILSFKTLPHSEVLDFQSVILLNE